MTLENAKVLYAHRLELGKPVEDLLARYPELGVKKKEPKKEEPKEVKKDAKKL